MSRFQFPVRSLPVPIQEFAADMEQIVDHLFQRPNGCRESERDQPSIAFVPAMDIDENDTTYQLSIDLPGVQAADVKLEVHEDKLTVSGTRSQASGGEGWKQKRTERSYGAFRRAVALPKNADLDHIDAAYQDGVLVVSIPKVPNPQPRTIDIRSATVQAS